MKKIIMLFLFVFPLVLFAQDGGMDVSQEEGFQMGGSVGATTINGETYTRIRLNPEIVLWKFGIGLDIDFLITGEGDIREEDWDEWQDYVNKILYLRYAHRQDPFYALVGSFPSYTLANGLIVNGYTNMLNYPDNKKIGGYFGFNTELSGFGMEMFAADFTKMDIFASRAHFKPLEVSNFPLLSQLDFGISFAHDVDQYERFDDKDGDNVPDIFDAFPDDDNYAVDTDGDGFPDPVDNDGDGEWDGQDSNNDGVPDGYDIDADGDNIYDPFDDDIQLDTKPIYDKEEDVTIVGTDYRLPLVDYDYFKLYHYAEYAKIIDYGQGFIFPGFGAKFAIFDMKLEGRRFEDEFIPGFFDYLYDDQRAFVQGQQIYTKTSILDGLKASTGWYGAITANIGQLFYFDLAYQDMYGEDVTSGKSLWAGLRADTSMIPKINEASIEYAQRNKKYINFKQFRNENATVTGKISYELGGNSYLVGNYQERYSDMNNDGKIKGEDEIAKTFSFTVEFKF